MDKKKKFDLSFFVNILAVILCLFWFVMLTIARGEKAKLEAIIEFESIKEGVCVYVEYPNSYDGDVPIPGYILVYDYEVDKVIEIDIYDELVYTRINVGDTILYCVDYNYTDADFLNVVKQN